MSFVTAGTDLTRKGGRRQGLFVGLALCLSLVFCAASWALTTDSADPSSIPAAGSDGGRLGAPAALGELDGTEIPGLAGMDELLGLSRLWGLGGESTSSWDLPWVQPRRAALGVRGGGSGRQQVNLESELRPGRSVSFTSTYSEHRGEEGAFGFGPAAADSTHQVTLELSQRTRLEAGMTRHEGARDPWTGNPGEDKQEQKVQFSTNLGPGGSGGLRLGLTSTDVTNGSDKQQMRTTEAHLNLAPASGLKLRGDFSTLDTGSGETKTTQSLGATMALASKTELTATMRRVGGAEDLRETGLALATELGPLGLKAEEKRTENAGAPRRFRKYHLTGGFGGGARSTKVAVEFQDSQGEGTEDARSGGTKFQLNQALGPGLALKAERRERIEGTTANPAVSTESACEVTAKLGAQASLTAGTLTGERADGTGRGEQKLALAGTWGGARMKLEERQCLEGDLQQSRTAMTVELPHGELPEWAKGVATSHEFKDAKQYVVRGNVFDGRERQGFAGWRAWAISRGGGGDDGLVTLGLAHRRMIGNRFQLGAVVEQRPEARDGDLAGRPLPMRRALVEVGAQVGRKLSARCGLGLETGLDSADDRVARVGLGVWGELGRGEQVEASVSHDAGRWQGEARRGTSVSLLYAHRVSEEQSLEMKIGYGWGAGLADGRARDCRVTLGYEKPI